MMMFGLSIDEAAKLVALIGSIIGVLAAAVKGGWWVYRVMRRLDERMEYVDSEMRHNGGATMRDMLCRLESRTENRLHRIEGHLGIVEPQVSEIHEAVVDGDNP